MRRFLTTSTLVLLLTVPVIAGEIGTPGKTEPPPCTQNCSASTQAASPVTTALTQFLITLITLP